MSIERAKVAIIGSGNVGSNAALFTALSGTADIILLDIVEGLAEGRALDMSQSLAIIGNDTKVTGGDDFSLLAGVDIVVITAGLPRQPGMTRIDLLHKNASIIKSAVANVKTYAPEALLMIVTNPLDIMTHLAWQEMGGPTERVIGMGGLLDSGRFTYYLAEAAQVSRAATDAIVIGSHGDEMVPVQSRAAVSGVPFTNLLNEAEMTVAAENARLGGARIVSLLKKGSAAYGPGAAISLMLQSIIRDEKRVFSVCAYAQGEYGQKNIYLNLPTVLGAGGAERIVEIDLTEAESESLDVAAKAVRAMLDEL
jgi:malate dehydrogenase